MLPTATLIPAGLDVTRSPLRPLAVTVNVTLTPAGLTVSVAVLVTPARAAVMVAAVEAVVVVVEAVKVALVAPAATVTLAGTVARTLLLESATTAPPAGAALAKVTLPCEVPPPVTLAGFSARLFRLAAGGGGGTGVTVSVVVRLAPL